MDSQSGSQKGNEIANLDGVILDLLPWCTLVVDSNMNVVRINQSARKILGVDAMNPIPFSLHNIIDTDFVHYIMQKISCVMRSGKENRGKVDKVDMDGKRTIYKSVCKLVNNHEGTVLVNLIDIMREEELKRKMAESYRSARSFPMKTVDENILFTRLNEAVMQSANTIVITDLDGNIVFANPKFEETTGYTLQEAFMKNPRILKSDDQPPEYYSQLWETITGGQVWKGEFRNRKKSGEFYWESATITPIKDAAGNVIEYLAIKEDITEQKLMEEKLEKTLIEMEVSNWEYKALNEDLKKEVARREKVEGELKLQKGLLQELNENLESQVEIELAKNREKDELMLLQSRQAAMGEMIGNIAHQWRQPLNAIGLMVYDLTDAYRFGELTPEYVDKSENNIKSVLEHMSRTIDDFRNFFKPNREKIDFLLHEIIKTSVSFLDATLKNSGIQLITEVQRSVELFGYPNEFAQVLLNILNNSKDALLDNRVIKPVIRISGETIGDRAVVKVVDNGGGIPSSILHKIFDPYFTTKEQGKGIGVGLYMSKTIVERNMGGTIVASNVRNGAEFTITIPLAEKVNSKRQDLFEQST